MDLVVNSLISFILSQNKYFNCIMEKNNKIEKKILKLKNIKIIYATTSQYWGITLCGTKKQIGLTIFNIFLQSRHQISYIDSKIIKKDIRFTLVSKYVHIFLDKTVKIIKCLNNNLICSNKNSKIQSIVDTSDFLKGKFFLKGFGGKQALLPSIISKIPKRINNYYDFFLGNGSVLFAVLHLKNTKRIIIRNKIYAFDINIELINVYVTIQNNYEELYRFLEKYSFLYNLHDCLQHKRRIYT